MHPTASVIVPTRNRLPHLAYTLQSLRHQQAPAGSYEVVVIDDASTEDVGARIAALRTPYPLRTLRNPRQLGRAMTRNRGLEVAAGELAIFLDGDMICPPSFVSAHLRLHAAHASPTVVTCVSGYPWCWRTIATLACDRTEAQPLLPPRALADWAKFERFAGGPLGDPEQPARVAQPEDAAFTWFVTAACSLRRSVALELGGFDARFVGYGLEDWELGYRVQRRGVRFIAHPSASAFHQAHPPTDRGPGDAQRNLGTFLELHPVFAVGLMFLYGPGTDGRYERLYGAYQRLVQVAPALAAGLEDVVVDHARAGRNGHPAPLRPAVFWVSRWGAQRFGRMQADQIAALGDEATRPLVSLFRQLTGIEAGNLAASPRRIALNSLSRHDG